MKLKPALREEVEWLKEMFMVNKNLFKMKKVSKMESKNNLKVSWFLKEYTNMYVYIFFLISFICFTACDKSEDTLWLYYDETNCTDPWGDYDIPKVEKKENVKQYFEDIGVNILSIKIIDQGVNDVCLACHCKTGKIIKCNVMKEDMNSLKSKDFYQ